MRRLASSLFALAATAALAAAAPEEISRPQPLIAPTPRQETDCETEIARLRTETGASWRIRSVNGATGSIHLAYGSGIDLGTGTLATAEAAEAAARLFVRLHPGAFGLADDALELWRASAADESWGVSFRQLHHGLRVLGGRVNVTLTREGRVYVFGADAYPGIDVDVVPSLSPARARSLAQASLGVPSRPGSREPRLMILPVHTGERVAHHLVWQLEDRTDEPVGRWISYVDAHSGEVLWRQNAVYFLDVTGTVSAVVEDPDYCAGPAGERLGNMLVSIQGGGSAVTDANGQFSIPSGTSPVTLELRFQGPFLDVNRDGAVGSPDAVLTIGATPGTPVDIVWNEASSRWDERDVFLHGIRTHDWMKALDPAFTDGDYPIPATVGINQSCNAFWDGFGINFFEESATCSNTGRIGGVVYHEYGHGVTQFIYDDFGDGPPGDLHEGNSDVLANLIEGVPLIANGFNKVCGQGIRDSDNTLCWPEDRQGEGHFDGQMIAGFHWLTRENLMASLGAGPGAQRAAELWHFGRSMGLPFNQDDQVFWTFVADDDNGDLDDGTPNYAALCSAAEAHCYICPDFGVEIRHTPPGPLAHAGSPLPISAKVYSTLGAIDGSRVVARYSVNGGPFVDAPLTGSGADSMYAGSIPAQAECALVDYFISADDVVGTHGTDPAGAPATTHRIVVDPFFGDDFETNQGWTVGAFDDGATDGMWERVDPVGSFFGAQPVAVDEDHSLPGTLCFVTGQNVAGQSIQQNDVDGGTTTLTSPVWNLSGAVEANLHYFRWYTDDVNTSPQEEFWIAQLRNNGGSWTDIENTTDSANEWLAREVDLVARYGGAIGNVQVRFRATDRPPNNNIVEAGIDDVWVESDLGCGVVAVEPTSGGVPGAAFLAPVGPNPARSSVVLRYAIDRAVRVELGIYDVSGRLVRRLVDADQAAGNYALRWDRRSGAGIDVTPGTYFARLTLEGRAFQQKITVVQ